ncbi:MAG: oligosaccharide flippase family protein [Bacteroidales bacterium]|nr:oligosaccharide flippase family protein [Bacteroidales bacterium]
MVFFNNKNFKAKLQKPVLALQTIQIIRYVTLIIISIAFVKSKLNTEKIGIYEKFFFFASALIFFWLNALIQNLISSYNTLKNEEKKIFLFNNYLCHLFFSFLILLVIILFESPLSKLFINSENLPYPLLFYLYLIFVPVGSLTEYIYLILNKIKYIYRYCFLSYLVQLFCITIPTFFSDNLVFPVIGLVFAYFLRFTWANLLIFKNCIYKFSFKHIKKILLSSSPLMLSFFIAGYINYIDGIFISQYFSNEIFAIFRYGAREMPLTTLLLASLSNAMIPVISNSYNLNTPAKSIKYRTIHYMNVLFPLSIIIAIISPIAFKYIYSPQFTESAFIFNILLCLLIPRLVLPQTFLIAKQKNNIILLCSFAELTSKVILAWLLIDNYGIAGLAISSVLAAITEKILLLYFSNKYFRINLKNIIEIKRFSIYSILLISTVIISYLIFK